MAIIHITIYGKAQPAGSKKSLVPLNRNKEPFRRPTGGVVVRTVDDNPHSRSWKNHISYEARNSYGASTPKLEGCLRVAFVFYEERPKGHYRTDGASLSAKGLRSPAPAVKPDVLKLARAAEDALTGVIWRDDAQIVDEFLYKRYGSPARLEIYIEEVETIYDFS